MSRSSILILLGFLTVLAPLSGFPSTIRSLITVVLGVCVLCVGLTLRTRAVSASQSQPVPPVEPPPPPPHGVSPI